VQTFAYESQQRPIGDPFLEYLLQPLAVMVVKGRRPGES
jgi:hypothetical protein